VKMQEINQLTAQQLVEKIEETRRALFALRLNAVTASVKDYSQFRKLRTVVARMMTSLNQRASH
jgi:ribosomal protein L29